MPKYKEDGQHLVSLIQKATEGLSKRDQKTLHSWLNGRDPKKLDMVKLEEIYNKIVKTGKLGKADVANFVTAAAVSNPASVSELAPVSDLLGRPKPRIPRPLRTSSGTVQKTLGMIPGLHGNSSNCEPVLKEMQCLSGLPKAHHYGGIPFEPFTTVATLPNCKPHAAWLVNPVGKSIQDWAKEPWHCNFLVLIHAPHTPGKHSPGKALLICELNITDVEEREHVVAKILKSRMCGMLKELRSSAKQVWVNKKCPVGNNGGICLALALEWMVELIVGGEEGLDIQRGDKGQVTAVKGFRLITL
ncbi:hypothetical protein B0H19DRAFT_1067717 [Mycena capillaripes]|nr:hypothetical protein B0H19DRAFT_1067717 [Mycena capillaripes]